MDQVTQPAKATVWPAGDRSLVLRALSHATGKDFAPDAAKIVEYEDFPIAVIRRFGGTVSRGGEDSMAAFRRFASEDFSRFLAFQALWSGKAEDGCLVVSRAALRADPEAWLTRALALLAPDLIADKAATRKALARATAWLDRHPAPALDSFAHYDAGLFDLLGRLNLKRAQVQTIFGKVMERDISEAAILPFQTQESPAALRKTLMSTQEYQRAQRLRDGTATDFKTYDQEPPEVVAHAKFHDHEILRKTRLGWPRSQLFVSRDAKLIYCPIGKVACSFLKSQMVRISDLAHSDLILSSIHAMTDRVVTGVQLSDYSHAEAEAFLADPEMVRFAVLRDPRDRVLSAYVEKLFMGRTNAGNISHARELITSVQAKQGLTRPDFERGITFRDFVTEIVGTDPALLDTHWRPQSLYLEGVSYDRIFGLHQIDEVVDLLEARSGKTLPRQPQNVTGSGKGKLHPGAADLLPGALDDLPRLDAESFFDPEIDAMIRTYFADDFRLFEQTLVS